MNPYRVVIPRLDGAPALIVSQEVAALDTHTDATGVAIGTAVVLKTGREILVKGNVPDVAEKVFPTWLDG